LKEKLSEDSRRRLDTNPLRILDTKSPEEQEIVAAAPKLADSLSETSRKHFAGVLSSLGAFGLSFQVEPRLVRGLDYYTNTVFEIVSEGLGAQNAICGGGAYEGLIEELGGDPTYGVGFAIGEDRLLEVLPADSPARVAARAVRPVLVAWAGGQLPGGAGPTSPTFDLAEEFRRGGVAAVDAAGRTGKSLYAHAEQLSSPFLAFLGEAELAAGTVKLRDTASREEQTLPRAEAIARLRAASTEPRR
jgi:histidyl-tRNA synthetase